MNIVEFVNSNAGIWAFLALLAVVLPFSRYIYYLIEDKLAVLEKKLIISDENLVTHNINGDWCIRGARVYHDNRYETKRYIKAYERLDKKGYIEYITPTQLLTKVSKNGKERAEKLKDNWLEWFRKL